MESAWIQTDTNEESHFELEVERLAICELAAFLWLFLVDVDLETPFSISASGMPGSSARTFDFCGANLAPWANDGSATRKDARRAAMIANRQAKPVGIQRPRVPEHLSTVLCVVSGGEEIRVVADCCRQVHLHGG
eukprot:1751997-Rhodomonas_salina.3